MRGCTSIAGPGVRHIANEWIGDDGGDVPGEVAGGSWRGEPDGQEAASGSEASTHVGQSVGDVEVVQDSDHRHEVEVLAPAGPRAGSDGDVGQSGAPAAGLEAHGLVDVVADQPVDMG